MSVHKRKEVRGRTENREMRSSPKMFIDTCARRTNVSRIKPEIRPGATSTTLRITGSWSAMSERTSRRLFSVLSQSQDSRGPAKKVDHKASKGQRSVRRWRRDRASVSKVMQRVRFLFQTTDGAAIPGADPSVHGMEGRLRRSCRPR